MRRYLPVGLPAAAETPELEASPQSTLFDPRMKLEGQHTVVLLGMSGAGKSSLGNLLVFGDPYYHEGFEIGHGADPTTTHCEPRTCLSDKCRLTVHDSPGVPDTNSAKTFARFDEIVAMIRRLTSLNAIVFLIKSDRQEEGDYRVFRTLLKQFSKLPCGIVMACRVDTTDCEHLREVKAQKEQAAHELMDRVIGGSQLGRDRVRKFLLHHGDLGLRDAYVLRWFLCTMPGFAVARETLLTTGEIEARYRALSNAQTRIEALREESDDLMNSLEKLDEEIAQLRDGKNRWQLPHTGLNLVSKVAAGARAIVAAPIISILASTMILPYGSSFVDKYIVDILEEGVAGWEAALDLASTSRNHLDTEKDQTTEELNSGQVDPLKLKVAREEWEELQKLLER